MRLRPGLVPRLIDDANLCARLNIPEGLRALGVGDDRLEELTEMALQDPSTGGNPVEMTRENTLALFRAAL